MKKRPGNGSSAFLLRAEREKTHLAAAAAAYGDGREGRRAASPPEVDAAQLLAMDTTKRPLRLTAPSLLPYLLADWGATDGTVLDKLADRTGDQYGSLSLTMPPLFIQEEDDRMFLSQRRDLYSWDPDPTSRVYMAVHSAAETLISEPGFCSRSLIAPAAGPREPRIMRSSATHVAGHPWDFRQAYRLAATCYCSTQIHAYICQAAAEEKKRVVNCVSIQRPPIEDIIHARTLAPFSCVSTCMVHLPESQRYLCVTIISLRDTTLAPIDDQDVKGHFGSGEEGSQQY
uniref:Uncharacterized protein n=1 Tax=Oryza glumipatula TaxID=40148 RepID=A0A0D9YBY1_9ORYZ